MLSEKGAAYSTVDLIERAMSFLRRGQTLLIFLSCSKIAADFGDSGRRKGLKSEGVEH